MHLDIFFHNNALNKIPRIVLTPIDSDRETVAHGKKAYKMSLKWMKEVIGKEPDFIRGNIAGYNFPWGYMGTTLVQTENSDKPVGGEINIYYN